VSTSIGDPAPAPAQQPSFVAALGRLLGERLLLWGVIAWLVYQHYLGPFHPRPGPSPTPAVDIVAEARAYGREILADYAAANREAAAKIRNGASLADAQKTLRESWAARDEAAYTRHFAAAITAIVPEKDNLKTPEERERFAALLESIATGVERP
jgi:hypothetical protein